MRVEEAQNRHADIQQADVGRWIAIKDAIKHLAEETTELGILAEDAFKNAAAALYGPEADAAYIAIENHHICMQSWQSIHQVSLDLLSRSAGQPDCMRQVIELQRIAPEFLRVAEDARAIAEHALALGGRGEMYLRRADPDAAGLFLEVVRQAYIQVRGCVIAATTHDTAIARRLIVEDGELDRLFLTIKGVLERAIVEESRLAGAFHRLLLVSVQLENIGNHVVAICDTLLFNSGS